MSSYVCSDQTIMAAAEGLARYYGCGDDGLWLADLLRRTNETASNLRRGGETEHRPVDLTKHRRYDDLEIIGACRCLAYQLDESAAFADVCDRLRAVAETLKEEGAQEGRWRLPDKTKHERFDGVYLPTVYRRGNGQAVTVYDSPARIPWGIDD